METIILQRRNKDEYVLLYNSVKFKTGLTVTGYIIYPDLSKSAVYTFDELGDGIYNAVIPFEYDSGENISKYGVVVKENGKTKQFRLLRVID